MILRGIRLRERGREGGIDFFKCPAFVSLDPELHCTFAIVCNFWGKFQIENFNQNKINKITKTANQFRTKVSNTLSLDPELHCTFAIVCNFWGKFQIENFNQNKINKITKTANQFRTKVSNTKSQWKVGVT